MREKLFLLQLAKIKRKLFITYYLEMIGAIVHQLTRKLSEDQIRTNGFASYFVDHTAGVYPTAASGFPWSAASMAVKGDPIADLTEDLAAEQKARVTYDNILRMSDDPDVNDVIKFLREREIVHFQRFGEAIEKLRAEFDPAERVRLTRKIERIIHEDQPYTFLYTPYSLAAVSSRFGNVRVFPGGLMPLLFVDNGPAAKTAP